MYNEYAQKICERRVKMSKVKASFSRKPVSNRINITGIIARGFGVEGSELSELTIDDAQQVMNAVIKAIDDTAGFDVETLDVSIG